MIQAYFSIIKLATTKIILFLWTRRNVAANMN